MVITDELADGGALRYPRHHVPSQESREAARVAGRNCDRLVSWLDRGPSTIEYEAGALHDLEQILDEITPPDRDYRHHLRRGDDNGDCHVRAAIIGPPLTLPFVDGELTLGAWQQICS